jgi:hypothetical protein
MIGRIATKVSIESPFTTYHIEEAQAHVEESSPHNKQESDMLDTTINGFNDDFSSLVQSNSQVSQSSLGTKCIKLNDAKMPDSDKYEYLLVKREKKSITSPRNKSIKLNFGDSNALTPTKHNLNNSGLSDDVADLNSSRLITLTQLNTHDNAETEGTSTLIKKTYMTLLILFTSNMVMFMCFPSVLYLHFT